MTSLTLVQRCAESTPDFIEQCMAEHIPYTEILHIFNRPDEMHSDVLMKILRYFSIDGIDYMLRILSETTNRQRHIHYNKVFFKQIQQSEAYFKQWKVVWPSRKEAFFDNMDKTCQYKLYQHQGKTLLVLKDLEYMFHSFYAVLEEYVLSRMYLQGAFEPLLPELRDYVLADPRYEKLQWLLELKTPLTEEGYLWMDRFKVGGFAMAEHPLTFTVTEESTLHLGY